MLQPQMRDLLAPHLIEQNLQMLSGMHHHVHTLC